MVNDDVNNKAINLEIKVAQYSAKAILKAKIGRASCRERV